MFFFLFYYSDPNLGSEGSAMISWSWVDPINYVTCQHYVIFPAGGRQSCLTEYPPLYDCICFHRANLTISVHFFMYFHAPSLRGIVIVCCMGWQGASEDRWIALWRLPRFSLTNHWIWTFAFLIWCWKKDNSRCYLYCTARTGVCLYICQHWYKCCP